MCDDGTEQNRAEQNSQLAYTVPAMADGGTGPRAAKPLIDCCKWRPGGMLNVGKAAGTVRR